MLITNPPKLIKLFRVAEISALLDIEIVLKKSLRTPANLVTLLIIDKDIEIMGAMHCYLKNSLKFSVLY